LNVEEEKKKKCVEEEKKMSEIGFGGFADEESKNQPTK